MNTFTIKGNYVDIKNRKTFVAELTISEGKITSVKKLHEAISNKFHFIIPGFIDAHVHIESSMLVPAQFARLAVVHGTIATVSDPHEIANVCGRKGVDFMIEDGKRGPFKFNFGAPSCVPATTFETAGAALNSDDIEKLLQRDEIKYLTEMMNFPGVLNGDEEVMKKIRAAQKYGKPVDGHAPGLRGETAKKYIDAGITTDHECFTEEEALDKLNHGMKIIIREGSAAKNFDALINLLNDYPEEIMFCSDDKHPDSLVEGHINQLCARAVKKGIDVFKVLQAACINPVHHYKLNVGILNEGDDADFILVKDLEKFEVFQTYINGVLVAKEGISLIKNIEKEGAGNAPEINNFNGSKTKINDYLFPSNNTQNHTRPVIEALDGQLITNKSMLSIKVEDHNYVSDVDNDILKIVVVNRYFDAPIAKAFIKNFGLKRGAIASSVAHDSHNIVAVGVDDESICKAVNLIIEQRGGISCIDNHSEHVLPLPIAGLMSAEDGYIVAEQYAAMDKKAKALGSQLSAPYMTLSFMALLVIPHLKLSDKGLFDGDAFAFID